MFQGDLFPPKSDWKPPLVSELPSFADAKRIAFDVETKDPKLKKLGCGSMRDGQMVGFSYAIEDGPSHYIPLFHAGGDNVADPWKAIAWLKNQAAKFKGELVGARLQYDLCFALSAGVEWNAKRYLDVQVAEALLDELKRRYNLESLCQTYDLPGKDEEMMREAAAVFRIGKTESQIKANMWQLPGRYLGKYGEADADRPLRILRRQEKQLEEQDLMGAWDLECRVLPALFAMRRRGVLIDQDHLSHIEDLTYIKEKEFLAEANRHHTYHRPLEPSDLNRPLIINDALKTVGMDSPHRTATGKVSVTKEFLESLPGEVGGAIRSAKKWNKIRTTFCNGIREHMLDGRIHCWYNQTRGESVDGEGIAGAATYRLSCQDPNLQQQPARDPELGPLWRKIYIPDDGLIWACNDFSQQEPRFTTHFAAVMDYPRARDMAQRFCDDPDTDNHQMMADVTGTPRKYAKEIFLGHCYGQGGAKTAIKIGLDTTWATRDPDIRWGDPIYQDTDPERYLDCSSRGGFTWQVGCKEARDVIDKVDEEVPYVKKLADAVKKKAEKQGYITTYYGHRCRFPLDSSGKRDWTHKALNRLIQTSSAGQTKMSVVLLHEAGEAIQLQVHDEIDGGVESRAHAEKWSEMMMDSADLMVPSKVDVECGPSWGEIE